VLDQQNLELLKRYKGDVKMTRAATGTKILPKERVLIGLIVTFLVVLLFTVVVGQAMLTKVNVEVEALKDTVTKQEATNEVLVMKKDELSSYDKIDAVANAEGLAYNNNNIKSID